MFFTAPISFGTFAFSKQQSWNVAVRAVCLEISAKSVFRPSFRIVLADVLLDGPAGVVKRRCARLDYTNRSLRAWRDRSLRAWRDRSHRKCGAWMCQQTGAPHANCAPEKNPEKPTERRRRASRSTLTGMLAAGAQGVSMGLSLGRS